MKVSNVSRKSLFLYVGIFFCMLFFEEARLTPLFERGGADYPFLLTVNQYLHEIGEKTKIYSFNSFVHEKFSNLAGEDFLSASQNMIPKIAAWWEDYQQTKFAPAQEVAEQEPTEREQAVIEENGQEEKFTANEPTTEKPLTEELAVETSVQKEPAENEPAQAELVHEQAAEEKSAERAQTENNLAEAVQKTAPKTVLKNSEENTQENTADNAIFASELNTQEEQAEQAAPTPVIETGSEPAKSVAAAEDTPKSLQENYTYNAYNYPFNASLVTAPNTDNGIASYAVRIPDYGKKKRVLIIGDSMMMEGLGPTLHNRLRKRDNLDVHREGKYSSGLSRPDFYNWFENLPLMLETYQPDLLIMSLGANDTQDIVIDKKRYFIDTKEWAEMYLQRAKDFIALADNGKRQIIWVSLPVMGKEPYFTRTKCISKLQEEASKTVANARFINIEHLLTENGKYTTFYTGKNNQSIRLRSKDLIHVSSEGGEILTDYVLPSVDNDLAELYAKDVPVCYPPVAGMANLVVFTSALRQKQVEYYVWLPETKTSLTKPQNETGKTPLNVQKTIQAQFGNKRYPVLYLLHGATDSAKIFVEKMGRDLQEIATSKNVIIVAPSCEPYGWYVDSPLVADNQIASFITKELIPHIDSLYPTTNKRAIAGLSMGGHGALLLGFQNRNLFQSMASVSGVLDIREHKNNWKIKNLLGELVLENQQIWEEHAVNALIGKKWPATSPRHIIVVAGTNDKLTLSENRTANDLFHKRGFHIEYIEAEGTHDWAFWEKYIPETLAKQADFLNKQ